MKEPQSSWAWRGVQYALGSSIGLIPVGPIVAARALLGVVPAFGLVLFGAAPLLLVLMIRIAVLCLRQGTVRWFWWGLLTGSLLATIISGLIVVVAVR